MGLDQSDRPCCTLAAASLIASATFGFCSPRPTPCRRIPGHERHRLERRRSTPPGTGECCPRLPSRSGRANRSSSPCNTAPIHAGSAYLEVPEIRVWDGHPVVRAGRARRVELRSSAASTRCGTASSRCGTRSGQFSWRYSENAARRRTTRADRDRLRLRPRRGALPDGKTFPIPPRGAGRAVARSTTRASRRCRSAAASSSTIMRAARASRSR